MNQEVWHALSQIPHEFFSGHGIDHLKITGKTIEATNNCVLAIVNHGEKIEKDLISDKKFLHVSDLRNFLHVSELKEIDANTPIKEFADRFVSLPEYPDCEKVFRETSISFESKEVAYNPALLGLLVDLAIALGGKLVVQADSVRWQILS